MTTDPNYEYKGLMAQAWDLLRGDTSKWEDRLFYLEILKQYGGPALDVGCGTGRLLLDFMHQGFEMEGMDNSPEMLALCREKAAALGLQPVLYEQTMETLNLPRRYRTILIPSSSLQLLITPAQVAEAMRRFCDHLEPGGRLVSPFMQIWNPGEPLTSEWEKTAVRPDGAVVRRVARARFDPATECEDTEDLYQVIVNGQVVAEELHQRAPATRSYTQAQARAVFEQAGLVEIQLYSNFTFDPVKPEDTVYVAVGRKQ